MNMSSRWVLPSCVVAVPIALTAGIFALSVHTGVLDSTWTLLPSTCAIAVVGALLVGLRPRYAVGWLLLATGLPFLVGQLAEQMAFIGLVSAPGTVAGAETALWISNWIYQPALVPLFVLVPLYFPDGHLPSRRWRPLAGFSVFIAVALTFFGAFGATTLVLGKRQWPNPYEVDALAGVTPIVMSVAALATLALAVAAAASLLIRWRAADPTERRQIMWVVLALIVMAVGFALDAALAFLAPTVYPSIFPFLQLLPAAVPIAIAVAILRHQLFDIDVLVSRAVVYLILTALLVAAYVAAAAWVGAALPDSSDALARLVATALVAVAFAPLRDRLQRLVGRRLYGDRSQPYAALTRLGRQLQAASPPDRVRVTLVTSARQALRSPFAALESGRDGVFESVLEQGQRPADDVGLISVDLTHGGDQWGRLVIGQRGREAYTAADISLLADMARPIGAAVHAVQLSVDLHRSRERMVLSMEEERRRVGRDLHDSLGPQLAAISMQVEAAQDLVLVDPQRARAMLSDLLDQTELAVRETRQIAHTHRPPTLDALGLVPALQTHIAHLAAVPVTVQVPQELPSLPAAVEVAAYRIALEALQNVIVHAGARSCVLRVTHDGYRLTLEVADDGCGIPADHEVGLGLQSMAERAGELGGTLTVEGDRVGRGTMVRAVLPCSPRDIVPPSAGGARVPSDARERTSG
jgi:signal transduction histidine kinase